VALDPDIQLLILIAFLYLVLPVLVGTSVGMAAGIRFPQVGKLRGACLGHCRQRGLRIPRSSLLGVEVPFCCVPI
jgi:hypothetical protein